MHITILNTCNTQNVVPFPLLKHILDEKKIEDQMLLIAYLIFVADTADIVRGEFSCHVEKF